MYSATTTMTFIVALQASTVLGFLHGISPCGHSWPILAPFCVTARGMRKCINVWFFFCLGTTVACMLLGVVLGALGSFIPPSWDIYFGIGTAGILVILGIVVIFKPHWLHFEDERRKRLLRGCSTTLIKHFISPPTKKGSSTESTGECFL